MRGLSIRRVHLSLVAALVALSGLLSGCGADGESTAPPTGPPAARHGEQAVSTVLAVERVRAPLVSALKLVGLDLPREARVHLKEAEELYTGLSAAVRARDPALDREISRAFRRADRGLGRDGDVGRELALMRALSNQLLEGVQDTLVSRPAREDLGLRAQVALGTTTDLRAAYADALAGGDQRVGLQRSYGLLARSQVVARGLGGSLGPQRGSVVGTLGGMRLAVWPQGIERPSKPPPASARVDRAVDRVQAGLVSRYGL